MSNKRQTLDESKLPAPHRAALAIARAQGVEPIRSLEDLFLMDLSEEDGDEFHSLLVASRRAARHASHKVFDFGSDG